MKKLLFGVIFSLLSINFALANSSDPCSKSGWQKADIVHIHQGDVWVVGLLIPHVAEVNYQLLANCELKQCDKVGNSSFINLKDVKIKASVKLGRKPYWEGGSPVCYIKDIKN